MHDENIKFTSQAAPRAQIDILNFHNPSARSAKVALLDMNKCSTISATKKINMLIDAYSGSLRNALQEMLGLGNVLLVNNLQVVINNNGPPAEERHDDDELITSLLASQPRIRQRWRFSPDAKSANCNGLFYCDPVTNTWRQVHNAFVEEALVSAFANVSTLTADDRRYVNSRRGGGEMRLMLARKVLHEGFQAQLDENTDVFAVQNGLFDMHSRTFRAITPEDMVQTHADWVYDMEQARLVRPEVERFLAQIFPIECERRIVLCYMASLLSGRRKIKKFLILTDRRAGNNGKSTVSRLFRRFLGGYAKASTKFVCKGAFDRDRDSHDAGLEPFKGKRLLLAEELKKSMTLDVAMLKQYTGGAGETVEGRKCGSGEWFKFIWQAGFLLIFNEGDAPKFDAADDAFLERMVVAPMRSKFVPVDEHGRHAELEEEFTYPMDKEVDARFEGWLSAFADILLEHYDENGLDRVPDSMREWRADIADSSNTLAEWFGDNVELTGNKKDVLIIKELCNRYMDAMAIDGKKAVCSEEFTELVKRYFASKREKGVVVKSKHCWIDENKRSRSARWVVVGVKCADHIIGGMSLGQI
ncbi:hypothetical protein PLESTB_000879800 [Pleodorina starrii]|uniref:Bacteriophage/plasmid primase P4 C-terminal domain-containing protein n=1 Tax=Pleodorina starrii TaxID=330485 RepID=A0A9W6BLJ9_9CHLO|nr:hypothetical protein PLESTB_000875500 [Pleodorina starrii]GLC54561.1 hypothetical protein PLESTB_000879800 [Pleodorina starrii]